MEQKGDRVYTFTRDSIKWHKEQGHKIITISGSPYELVKEMASKYGFDDLEELNMCLIKKVFIREMLFLCGIVTVRERL